MRQEISATTGQGAIHMPCRIFILDGDEPDTIKGADPEAIARTSRLWKTDMDTFGPWVRTRIPSFDDGTSAWAWRPEPPADGKGPAVLICENCASTMDAAWHFIEQGRLDEWDSLLAVEQSAGRGQQKRRWISPAGNLHAAWRWPLPPNSQWDGLVSLMAGFILARVFDELGVAAKIKWPNDLILQDPASGMDRKFGGILVERRESHVVVGCGINIGYCPDERQLREESAVAATRLGDVKAEISPLFLWATLVEKGKFLFENLVKSTTPNEFVRMIETKMAWIGRTVLIRKTHTEVVKARIIGLAQDGGLRIKTGNTAEVLYSGSIIPA